MKLSENEDNMLDVNLDDIKKDMEKKENKKQTNKNTSSTKKNLAETSKADKEIINKLKKRDDEKVQQTLYITKEQLSNLEWLKEQTNRKKAELVRMALDKFFEALDMN